jgi:Baseplate J-like protein
MATPILYLDVDDEITSAAARIRAVDADRVALVLPYGSRLATSRINFRLLAREARERGKTIEIVAADSSARALAISAGLPVHASVAAFEAGRAGAGPDGAGSGEALGGEEPALVAPVTGPIVAASRDDEAATSVILTPPRSAEPVPVVGRRRPVVRPAVAIGVGLALAAVVGLGAILAFVLLPSASIVLAPRAAVLGPLSVTAEARPDAQAGATGDTITIPAQTIPVDVQVSQTFKTAGVKVTEAPATGSVTFQNCDTGRAVSIPANSVVSTPGGIGFQTQASLTIKRAPISPRPCTTGSVSVQAVTPGTSGNVAAGQITKVPPGYDPGLLFVTNPQPTAGGVHSETPQVSQSDVDAALAALNATLATALDTKIAAGAGAPSGTTLFPETKSLGTPTPSVDPKSLVGQAVTQFDLGLSATGTVVGVDQSPIRSLAEARLRSHVPDGWTLDATSIAIDIGTPTVAGEVVSFPVSMQASEIRTIDQKALLASILGLDLPIARTKLDDYGDVQINVWPEWVTTIPNNPDRVSLTLVAPRPAASPTP